MRWFLLLALSFFAAGAHAGDGPDDVVKQVANQVLAVLNSSGDITHDRKKLHDLADRSVMIHFDFDRMTRIALGESWKDATQVQKATLIRDFRILIANACASVLSLYDGQEIVFSPSGAHRGNQARVRTRLVEADGEATRMDFLMEKTASGWEIYDVVIDNVSMLSIYRVSFGLEVRLGGIKRLIDMLQERDRSSL
jgi:phospholipid transport system substrate-binding protein